jgi:hypothetical protein
MLSMLITAFLATAPCDSLTRAWICSAKLNLEAIVSEA